MGILVVQHAEHEGPGLLSTVFEDLQICRRWLGEPVPKEPMYDAVIVLGGPGAAWDEELQPEARLLEAAARAGVPTLGICLGAQLLARGLGARNFRGPSLEKGVFPISLSDEGRDDTLVAHLDGQEVVHWHQDTFELPPDSRLLASSAAYAHQAFRFGSHAWGIQFHPEVDQSMRGDWGVGGGSDEPGLTLFRSFAKLVFSLR